MEDATRRDLIESYIAAYNAFDVEGMLARMTDDVRFENWSGGTLSVSTNGVAALRQTAESSKTIFTERAQRVMSWKFEDELVVVKIAFRGVLAADMPGGPPKGTVLDLQGTSEFAFRDGAISRIVDRS